MGYHSTGAFRASGKTDDLFAVVATLRLTYPDQEALKGALKECTLSDEMFGFEVSGKWYSDYPEVKAFQAIMAAFANDEQKFSTNFVRIGEDYDDIETSYTGEGYDLVRFIRDYETEDYPDDTNLLSSTMDETRSDDVNQELVT